MTAPPPALFSLRRRASQQARRAAAGDSDDFIAALIADSLADRLTMVMRRFGRALLIGAAPPALATAVAAQSDQCAAAADVAAASDGDALFDLIVWPGGLEAVDDVPGALVRVRRMLAPDGLLIGALVGDGSCPLLRRLLVSDGMRAIPRMHPQIDLKSLGNLLQRAGFALPVADVEVQTLRYRSWRTVVADLRAAGLASQLAAAPPPLLRAELAALDLAFAAALDPDGRANEALRLVFFTGWAPHPDQPQPARRGSGKSSLAAALREISADPPES